VCHSGNKWVHLELCSKESCDGSKDRTQKDTHNQCKDHSHYDRQSCKVKDMSEDTASIDTMMHNNGGSGHTHTNHTSDRQVCTGQEDQSCNTQSQEHSRRCLLEDVQYIVVSQQR